MKLSQLFRSGITLLAAISLSACVTWGVDTIKPGQTEAQVLAVLGAPTHTYHDGDQHWLEYRRGRMAQATHMAHIGADGRLISYEQVLTEQKFAQIQPGVSTKQSVQLLLGAPYETIYYSRVGLLAWSYPYKEQGVWNSLMAVYFDDVGTVRKLENGPDPLFDPSEHGHAK